MYLMNMTGTIPATISQLSSLTYVAGVCVWPAPALHRPAHRRQLTLKLSYVRGTIPAGLGSLSALT